MSIIFASHLSLVVKTYVSVCWQTEMGLRETDFYFIAFHVFGWERSLLIQHRINPAIRVFHAVGMIVFVCYN